MRGKIDEYAALLIKEQTQRAYKFGFNTFEESDKELIADQLAEFPEVELELIMKDKEARANLAGALVTLLCLVSEEIMFVTEEELEQMGITVDESKAQIKKDAEVLPFTKSGKKKSDTTH